MIDTSVTFTTNTPSANPQSAAEEHSANFAQVLTNHASQVNDQNLADNTESTMEQQDNTLVSVTDFFADETNIQIDEDKTEPLNPSFTPLTADQFIDQLPIQLATVATQLRLESNRSTLTDETSGQEIIEQLTNNSENSDENLGVKKYPTLLSTSATNSPSIEYPLSNLATPFTKQATSQSQPLLEPIPSDTNATTLTNTVQNPELINLSPSNNNAIPLTIWSANASTLTHLMAPGIDSIALTTPIEQPEWGQKFSEQIVMLSRHGSQQAELRLHPEELGSLQIQLKIVDDKAQLSVVTTNQQVRQIIESNLPQLRHALSEQGIQLGQTHVGDQHNEQNSPQNNQPATPLSSITHVPHEQESDSSLTKVQQSNQAQITTGIDVFA